jgi:photosystem II stability/assembly factor-like uncharacterized protein
METTLIPLKSQDFHGRMKAVARVSAGRVFSPQIPAITLVAILAVPGILSASWLATGPFGGDADIVRAIPHAKGQVVAAAHNGLIFTSSNGAASWKNLPFPAQFSGVLHALEVDPRAGKTWYVGVESEIGRISGVYKTTDAGTTWSHLPGTAGIGVWSLAVFPGDSSVVAAGTSNGVYLSHDAGATWKHITRDGDTEIRPVVSLAFHPTESKILYAGTTHLPWRTMDGGATWQSIHTGMIDDSDVFSIQVDAKNPSHVMASACSGVYNSMDGGSHWKRLETPRGAFRTHFVAIDPRHSGVIFAGTTDGLLKSVNGGHAWRKVSPHSVHSLAFDPGLDGRVFFAATSGRAPGGLLVSTDEGSTLHESMTGFTNRSFTTLSGSGLALYSSSVYEAGSGGAYRTENLAARWDKAAIPAGDQLVQMTAAPDDSKRLYAAGYHGISESKDGGLHWTSRPMPQGASAVSALLPLEKGVLLAATSAGLFRSVNGGAWTQVSGEAMQPGTRSLQRSASAVAALTKDGAIASLDAGVTWKACGSTGVQGPWYGLAFKMQPASVLKPANPSVALAATPAGLFRSTDGCGTWTAVHDGLQQQTVSLVLFHPTRVGEAFASQGGRIFVSTDGGQRWQPLDGEAAGNAGPASLVILSAAPDTLFALFPRRGVYSTGIGMWTAAAAKAGGGAGSSSMAATSRND